MPTPTPASQYYEIHIKEHLDDRWADWFNGLDISLEEDGSTILSGPLADQAALHGILKKVRDLGLTLISVNTVKPDTGEVRKT